MMRNVEETIGNFVRKGSVVQLSYLNQDGFPVTKAMLKPRIIEGIKYYYFTTNTSSNKVKCLKTNNKACIYFYNQRFYRGVCLIGTIEVLEDYEIKKEVWKDGDEMFYPKGYVDSDYCVLKFTAIEGSYFCNLKNERFEIK
jgi:general stress protein 26